MGPIPPDKLIIKPTSANFAWGVYGFTDHVGWEDIHLCDAAGESICTLTVIARPYLREGLETLEADPDEAELVQAIHDFLKDTTVRYWYYYSSATQDGNVTEVPYEAPRNAAGHKPSSTEIWFPGEGLGFLELEDAVREFARTHLNLASCEAGVCDCENYEDALRSFAEYQQLMNKHRPLQIEFSPEMIAELSLLWKMSPEKVRNKLLSGHPGGKL